MTQEDKDLLLRDLCARLPYGVKGVEANTLCSLNTVTRFKSIVKNIEYKIEHLGFKPYLFPLSSMTEEQKNQLKEIWDADMNKALDYAISGEEGLSDLFQLSAAKKVINWFIKNYFDFQGLIPKELAIDCTNLNVY